MDSRAVTRLDVWSQMILIELFRWLMAVDDERMQQTNSTTKKKLMFARTQYEISMCFRFKNKCTQTVLRWRCAYILTSWTILKSIRLVRHVTTIHFLTEQSLFLACFFCWSFSSAVGGIVRCVCVYYCTLDVHFCLFLSNVVALIG